MRNAFFCTTPYQVLNAFTLSKQIEGLSDIYIIDQFEKASQLVDAVKKSCRFEKVQLIHEYSIFKMKREGAKASTLRRRYLQIYIRLDKYVKEIIPDLSIYTDLFASCNSFVPRMFFLSAAKNKLDIRYHYYDDGIGSYYNEQIYRLSGFDYYARRLLLGKRAAHIKYDVYLYSPELFERLLPDVLIDVHKILAIQRDVEDRETIDRIYSIDSYKMIQQEIVFLDTVHAEMSYPMGHEGVMHEMNEILEKVGKKNVIIKPHPRDIKRWFDCDYYEQPSVPMEVLCMHQDFSNKILISFFSTSLITPKMLYGQEPVLIMLYKVLGSTINIELKDRLCKSMTSIYKDKDRVYVPETKQELLNIIETLKTKENYYA